MSIILNWLGTVAAAHQRLPRLARFHFITPLSIVFTFLGGRFFALPPGPLCDEGMILFMEGGCDYGVSNIFFFSKIGLLLGINVAFAAVWLSRRGVGWMATFPHLALLLTMVWLLRSGGPCDTYYSHPNGSLGQMILEAIGFAVLGIAGLQSIRSGGALRLLTALSAWNLFYAGNFYGWLIVTDHWTWLHSGLIVATFFGVACMLACYSATATPLPRTSHWADKNTHFSRRTFSSLTAPNKTRDFSRAVDTREP